MTVETIVAIYDTASQADAAVRDLKAANVPADAISQHAGTASSTTSTTKTTTAPGQEQGFWASLFGGDSDSEAEVYDRSLQSGSTVVTVKSDERQVAQVTGILEQHNPVDIDERAAGYGLSQTTTTTTQAPLAQAPLAQATPNKIGTAASTEGGTIQLAEEQLSVGKRAVNRGTTRIRRFVVETPVEEQVSLRDETIRVERRAVTGGSAAAGADFTEKTVEMTETDEEAVVAKTARVIEEVVVSKDVTERVETIKDTVRRDEVEIEKIPGGKTAAGSMTTPAAPRNPKI
ncbi:uncharacterized protein (TIGR02271 family) [Skermanella aerolata]|uniref:YsnF/AvaK domain-containing protein n=1 Tax=Skermanella aerolata TaxID=393310 RepID=UPI003D1F6EE7